MPEHYYQFDHHPHRRTLRRLKWFLFGLLITVPIILAILFFTTSIFVEREQEPVTSSVQTLVQAPSIRVFRTPYFQFQTGNSWAEDAKETTENVFVYRSYKGPLIEHDLYIYINPPVEQFDATRIQPVSPKEDGTFEVVEGISDHCDNILPEGNKDREQVVTFKEVKFMCDADDTIYDVLVGKAGGTPYMDLVRPSGTMARYVIKYRDLTAEPTGRELKEIVRSFQTR
jgi:hypothetical protein